MTLRNLLDVIPAAETIAIYSEGYCHFSGMKLDMDNNPVRKAHLKSYLNKEVCKIQTSRDFILISLEKQNGGNVQ